MRALRLCVLFPLPAISPVLLVCRFRDLFRVPGDEHIGHRWSGRAGFHGKLSLSAVVCLLIVFCAATIPSPAQTRIPLVSFNGTNGADPTAPLVQGTDGNFYGTTGLGGTNDRGTVFKMTPSGMLTTLYNFCSQSPPPCKDGAFPNGLVQATDGNFYGTTQLGGANGYGTVFKITPNGMLSTIYNFCSRSGCGDGREPYAGLVQGADGNFYGTTFYGGALGQGTVFEVTPGGALTVLHFFCVQSGCTDGANPQAGLVKGADGDFYGTTEFGGANGICDFGCGTVFKITPSGDDLVWVYSFCSQPNCADGYYPEAGLVQGNDGNFYGTASSGGGDTGIGTIFKITPTGVLSPLYSFSGADGSDPVAALVQAIDGNFYGTTSAGGGTGVGTIFEITPSGMLSTLHSFSGADGRDPVAALVQATSGNFYGTTDGGGDNAQGTIFELSGPSPTPVQFVPVTPCRLLDTRPQYGGNGPIQGGAFQAFDLPQLAQTKGCADLSSAIAYSLNVAVVPQGPLGYLTLWPTNGSRPGVATLNSLDGRIKANAAIVRAGSAGAVSVYVTNTTNVVIDIDGYFAPASGSTLAFYPMTPCRVADTRKSTFPQGLGPPFLSGQTERDFPVLSSTCNIPSTAQAYSLNLSAVPYPSLGHPLGYLEVWPKDQMPANPVSTLNNLTGTVVANAAIVPAGTGGDITVYPSNDTDLVIDINGYFAAAGPGGLSLYPAAPCRVIDTRQIGSGQPFSGLLSPPVDVADSACAPPSTAQAYVFNATVVPYGALGYLTLWQNDPMHQPVVSTLNALDGAITNNMAIVPTADGKIDAYASGITQLILDISSYFAP
jgi:uncharacterized repeat protein (TIGR03803 family)